MPCDSTGFNAVSAELVLEPQSNVSQGQTKTFYGACSQFDWGKWGQWEIHFKANDPGASNGVYEVFKNGTKVAGMYNLNTNGSLDMTGQSLEIGGVYTKLVWGKSSNGVCTGAASAYIGDGQDNCGPGREGNFAQQCYFTSECPSNGFVPIYKRYFDDIIVLKK